MTDVEEFHEGTLQFLIASVGLGTEDVNRLKEANDNGKTMRTLTATNSLILSVYTPRSAVQWYRQPNPDLAGKSAADLLRSSDPERVTKVFLAAYKKVGN